MGLSEHRAIWRADPALEWLEADHLDGDHAVVVVVKIQDSKQD
jgi:hypothetical protein